MKLLRLAIVTLTPFPETDEDTWQRNDEDAGITVRPMGTWRTGKSRSILYVAEHALSAPPLLSKLRRVLIPEEPRLAAEGAIEELANVLAVTNRCSRSLSSPEIPVAFLPEDTAEREWFSRSSGMDPPIRAVNRIVPRFPLDKSLLDALADRMDGVALMAEALSHSHATGRFHELMRLFERAFALGPHKMGIQLGEFLQGTRFHYSPSEVSAWVEARHPATHADRRAVFLLEGDVNRYVPRMEQAAFDVLFNKSDWRTPSSTRRSVSKFEAGTADAAGTAMFIFQHATHPIEAQILDSFGSYPYHLGAEIKNLLPSDWWYEYADKESPHSVKAGGTLEVVKASVDVEALEGD